MEKNTVKTLQHLSLAQIAVLNAIKSGCSTAKEISEKTGQFENGTIETLKYLAGYKLVNYVDGVASLPKPTGKTIRLGGNLDFPISFFKDSNGKFYVCRGKFHEISPDITLDQIEWFDDTSNEETELQKVMRGVKEQKIKEKKKALPSIKDEDGEPTVEDMKQLGAWRNVNELVKIYPCEVSAKRAIIEISPRFFDATGKLEYPFGACSPKQVVTIEVFHELLNGDTEHLPTYTLDDVFAYTPNTFVVKAISDEKLGIGFEYLSIKKSGSDMKIVDTAMYLDPKEKYKTLDTIVLDMDKGVDYIKKIAALAMTQCNIVANLNK